MFLFLFHRIGERCHRCRAIVCHGFVNHARVGACVLAGLAFYHLAQVGCGAVHAPRHLQVTQSVQRFGFGDFLEHLGDFRVSFLAGLLRVSSVGEVGYSFGYDSLPQVSVGGRYIDRSGS